MVGICKLKEKKEKEKIRSSYLFISVRSLKSDFIGVGRRSEDRVFDLRVINANHCSSSEMSQMMMMMHT
jgi:hypothetical protein